MRFMVSRLRNGLAELFALPDGYEIMLGNGGSTVFWDIATFGLIEHRSQHASFGEFSSKFAAASAAAPFLDDPVVIEERPRHPPRRRRRPRRRRVRPHPQRDLDRRADAAAAPRGRRPTTSSCSSTPPRPPAACASTPPRSTSTTSPRRSASPPTAASGSPRCSPAAVERIERIGASDRWIPESLEPHHRARQLPQGPDLQHARRWPRCSWPCSRSSGSTRTAASHFAAGRSDRSAEIIYGWAEASDYATPVRGRPGQAQPRGGHHRPRRRRSTPPR